MMDRSPDIAWPKDSTPKRRSRHMCLLMTAPEEACRKIEQCSPESEERASARQKQKEGGDAFECVGQTADSGASKFRSDGLGRRGGAFFAQGERDVCERDAAAGSITLCFHSFDFTVEDGDLTLERPRIVRFFGAILEQPE